METKEVHVPVSRVSSTRIFNPIFLYINEKYQIKLSKVFMFDDSDTFLGHIKLWDEPAPFYFIFNKSYLHSLIMKQYKDAVFLPNIFKLKTDKKGKLFLTSVMSGGDSVLNYYPIYNKDQYDDACGLKSVYKNTFIGYDQTSSRGEAFQIFNIANL